MIAHRSHPPNRNGLAANLGRLRFRTSSRRTVDRDRANFPHPRQSSSDFRGHFYNWYTRRPCCLHPQYISAVDSGNWSAVSLTSRVGLEELNKPTGAHPRTFQGLRNSCGSFALPMAPRSSELESFPRAAEKAAAVKATKEQRSRHSTATLLDKSAMGVR